MIFDLQNSEALDLNKTKILQELQLQREKIQAFNNTHNIFDIDK